jgi:hypothetical protein
MRRPGRGVELLARLGYGVRGGVYLIVGWFALRAAMAGGRVTTDTRGALVAMQHQSFGALLLTAAAAGLAGYAVWRLGQGLFDLDREGRSPRALLRRAGQGGAGLVQLGLAGAALRLALHQGQVAASTDQSAHDWTAWLLAQPLGRWAVAAVAATLLAAAAAQAVKAWRASFLAHVAADPRARRLMRPVGRVGFGAKAVVFALVGLFFLNAAWRADPEEAGGIVAALRQLQGQPAGPWLLGVVALGLAAFGLYSLFMARYRRIALPELADMPGLRQ